MSDFDWHQAKAQLEWQIDLGADEAIENSPIDRYALAAAAPIPPKPAAPEMTATPSGDPVAAAKALAATADSLGALAEAMQAFDGSDLKKGARRFVFSDGSPVARVMIIGEAPGRDEDAQGKPFVGRAGQLLDRMFSPIGMSRTAEQAQSALYITNVLPWRPPQNRDPSSEEIAMFLPFLERHVALADPDVIVPMGNISCQAVLGKRGITKLRGQWAEAFGRPALPMFHPAYLLRQPHQKRAAWADLLDLQARLRTL